MSRFLDNTAVEPLGGGRYQVTVDRGWWIVNGPNGGYVAALMGRAIEAEVDHGAAAETAKTLHSMTLNYLRPPTEGAAVIEVVIERRGRSVVTVTARMFQNDSLMVMGSAAVAGHRDTPEFNEVLAPEVPLPEDLPVPVRPADSLVIPMSERYEMRPCLGSAAGAEAFSGDSKPAVTGGWIRFAEPTPIDAVALAALTDAWFPPVMHKFPGAPMAVPTVDLTVHVRQLPADPLDWVLARFASPLAVGGYLIEDGEIWDRHGNQLAVSRQLAVLI